MSFSSIMGNAAVKNILESSIFSYVCELFKAK